ncbi:MAG: hypothetical protein CME06_03810 [Gemmatimonadetes bacterium]|nr:hypothetical protein [Gemmatimonadota bacterium]
MRHVAAVLLSMTASCAPALASGGTIGLTDPALSPDGETLAFVYLGDLWTVHSGGGDAYRLTTHVASESDPRFSPDGSMIAFTSDRWGNGDIYVMPASGGPARRITFHETNERTRCWSADGARVLFSAARGTRRTQIWSAPALGGDPRRITKYVATDAAISRDGGGMLATTGSSRWWRWGYRGSASAGIVLDRTGEEPRELLRSDYHDRWPNWLPGGREFLYVSAREGGVPNLFRCAVDATEPVRITNEPPPGVSFPALDAIGRRAVFVREGRLHSVDLVGQGEATPLVIHALSDDKETPIDRIETKSVDGGWDVDSGAEHLVASFKGELFAGKTSPGDDDYPQRLSHNAGRDDAPRFSPDGERIAFISDRGGGRDLWVIDAGGEGEAVRLTDDPEEDGAPQWSADGEEILFERGRGDLYIVPDAGGKARKIASGPQLHTPHRSPLGDWIVFERHNAADVGDICVIEIESGEEWTISSHPAHDQMPRWSPDGRKLLFESDRDGSWDIFVLTLAQPDKGDPDDEDEEDGSEEGKGERDDETTEDGAILEEVRRFLERGRFEPEKIPSTAGNDHDAAWSPDAKSVIFRSRVMGSWDLWKSDLEGGAPTQITQDGADETGARWIADDKIAYRANGRIYTGPATGASRVAVELEARFSIDRRRLHAAVFDEAWRALREQFYDPALHGADWSAVGDRYRDRLEGVWDRADLHRLISEMLGELNASHLGIWGGGPRNRIEMGHVGAELEPVDGDFRAWKIVSIVPKGPFDPVRLEVGEERPRVGDHIVRWDGVHQPVGALLDTLLVDRADRPIPIGLAGRARRKVQKQFTLRPLPWSEMQRLLYEDRIEGRQERVREASDGRVAYIHLSAMDQRNLRRFRQTLLGEAYEAEALIIDVRDNGGGHIHEQLLQALDRGPYALRHPRGGERSLQPANWRRRPAAVLINQRSGSDAEIFPEAFRALGLGPLVGVPTSGSVIGTGGMRLLDGSWLRLPTVGWYTLDGQNLENRGVSPDVYVGLSPADETAGRDPQLARAIELMKKEIGEAPRAFNVPESESVRCAAGRCAHDEHRGGAWIDMESWD